MLSEDKILSILNSELARCQGVDSDEISKNRTAALNAYFNKPLGNEIKGRSAIQSSDVADMVEGITASINPILTRDTLIKFRAVSEEDQKQADLESEFVNYMAQLASNEFLEVTSAVKDALLMRNGWIKVYIDSEEQTETVTKKGQLEFQIQQQIDESDKEVTWTVTDIESDEEAEQPGLYVVSYRKDTHIRELVLEAIAPEDMLFSTGHASPSLKGLRALFEIKDLTRSELREMGYSAAKVDLLPARDVDANSAQTARKDNQKSDDGGSVDRSQEQIRTYVAHALIDVAEDGIAKLWHCHFAESELLMHEEVEWMPYSTGSPVLMPHRLYGLSIYDKLSNLQLTKTAFLRMWIDNGNAVNAARLVFNPKETEQDDVADGTPGSGIRSKNPTNVTQVQTSDNGASISAALNYLDKVRSERTGASLDLASADMQLAGHNIGQMGAERQISLREQLASQMTAQLANTLIKDTFMLVHRTIKAFMPGTITAELAGKWQETNPSEWLDRKHVKVATGLSQGERAQMNAALMQMIQVQLQLMQSAKGQLVDFTQLYNALMDWARVNNVDAPQQYWIDPESDEGIAGAEAASEAMEAAKQEALEVNNSQRQQELMVFYMQQFLDKYKADQKTKYDYDNSALEAEIEEAKIVGTATLDLEREQASFDRQAAGAAAAVAASASSMPAGQPGGGQ